MKLKSNHLLSLIIPVYKQEKTIAKDLKRITHNLQNLQYDYELIIVFDGIVDNSLEKVKKEQIPKTKFLVYQENQGKGFALRLGMSHAKGEYVMFLDSGMEIDAKGISMLLAHMNWYNADIIIGSKRHPASKVRYTLTRKILSSGYHLFVKLLFGLGMTDTQAGIKVFKKKVIQRILPYLLEKKFAGDLEMLVVADLLGYKKVYEAPIILNYQLSSVTSAVVLNAIWGIAVDTLAIFYRKNILHYYDKPHHKFTLPKGYKLIE